MEKLRVAVIGGGIGGLAAALALRNSGSSVVVFEKARELREIGAGVVVRPNGMRGLQSIGVVAAVEKIALPVQCRPPRMWLGEPLSPNSDEERGNDTLESLIVYPAHRAELQRSLHGQLPADTVRLGHALTRLVEDEDGVELFFANGRQERFDLVVGADRIRSVVQGCIAEPTLPECQGIMAYRGLVPAERLAGKAEVSRLCQWLGQDRYFITYPVSLGRLINVVASVPTNLRGEDSWSAPGEVADLAREYEEWHPEVQSVISAMDHTFRWGIYDRQQPTRWTSDRVALLGDAAHAMAPYLGQGVNTAIEDAVTLGILLADIERADLSSRLRLYEQLRRDRTRRIQEGSRRMGKIYRAAELSAQERRERMSAELQGGSWLADHCAESVAQAALLELATSIRIPLLTRGHSDHGGTDFQGGMPVSEPVAVVAPEEPIAAARTASYPARRPRFMS
jgi:salicylate hydroxylase